MADRDWLAERFEANRPHLRAVAYRMLGSMPDAEDTVQDAWLRVIRADATGVHNLGGWLTTIVARLALDRLRWRATRPEEQEGVHVPDPIVTADVGDPEHEAELAEAVGLAMLVVLDKLTPAERIAFVLHDTFGLPFEDIAPIVERSVVATRQLASRARRRVRGTPSAEREEVPVARARELVDAFLAAAREGDFRALLPVLDPDVVIRADAGPLAQSRELRGAEVVSRQAVAFRSMAPGARRARVNGLPGLVVFAAGRPYAVLGFSFRGGRIAEVDILTDPERLARLDLVAVGGNRPS